MVNDYGRAEDISQDVFISALRRMRETDRPIAFKPWIYEIAKNACIDQFRRSRRAEEVSYDADEGLGAADYGRLVTHAARCPRPPSSQKMQLDHLCGAFGGLSETHHEILVMRELEGLSYREIGERLGMSRPSVESTLFRARRRLTEEYEELVTGARCRASRGSSLARGAASSARATSAAWPATSPTASRAAARRALAGARRRRHGPRRSARASPRCCRFRAFLRAAGARRRRRRVGRARPARDDARAVAGAVSDPSIPGWVKAAAAAATVAVAGAGAGAVTQGEASASTSASTAPRRSGDERAGQQHVRDQRAVQDHDGRPQGQRRRCDAARLGIAPRRRRT